MLDLAFVTMDYFLRLFGKKVTVQVLASQQIYTEREVGYFLYDHQKMKNFTRNAHFLRKWISDLFSSTVDVFVSFLV